MGYGKTSISLSFNPTLVRLRLIAIPNSPYCQPSFNPTLVRLRRGKSSKPSFAGSWVSIPRWFD